MKPNVPVNRFVPVHHKTLKPSPWRILFAGLVSTLLSFGIFGNSSPASGQSDEPSWSEPENLSRSGSASAPVSVVDSSGRIHVVWTDGSSGFLYARHAGESWSAPELIQLPFDPGETLSVRLLGDQGGRIHAAWIEDDNDLYVNAVPADFFTNRFRWRLSARLATNVIAAEITQDPAGAFHVLYLAVTEDPTTPSGIYHVRSINGGNTWTRPQRLYESNYFRSLSMEFAHLSVTTGIEDDLAWIWVGWDNPARERVLISRSIDGGVTWEAAEEIAGPVEKPDEAIAYNIKLAANGPQMLRLWQTGIPGEQCEQFYQASQDAGKTWSDADIVLPFQSGCPEFHAFIPVQPDFMVMVFRNRDAIYMMAWDGSEWGPPILQEKLTELRDPDTLNRVILGCLQVLSVDGRVYVIGCDDNLGGDLWTSNHALNPDFEWYPPPPLWSAPITIATAPGEIENPSLTMDHQGRTHLFWSQLIPGSGENSTFGIFYARRESGSWSTARVILQSPDGSSNNPTVAVDHENRLHVVWTEGAAGDLYYSWSNAALAVTASEWQTPVRLPVPERPVSSPDIIIDDQNNLYVSYAVQLNERRGIYLISSTDGGINWTAPQLVLDVETAGWDMVDRPQITWTAQAGLHVFLTRRTLSGGEGAAGLYYVRSNDLGVTWSPAEEVVAQNAHWSNLMFTNRQVLHRIWEQEIYDRVAFRHQISLDQGASWTEAEIVSGLNDPGASAVATDAIGRVHLTHYAVGSEGRPWLRHWIWTGQAWLAQESLNLNGSEITAIDALAAAVSPTGNISVVASGRLGAALFDDTEMRALISVNRSLEQPQILPTPLPTVIAAPVDEPTRTPPPPPVPTPNLNLASEEPSADTPPAILGQLDIWAGPAVGIATAGMVILVVLLLGLRRIRN